MIMIFFSARGFVLLMLMFYTFFQGEWDVGSYVQIRISENIEWEDFFH